MILTATLKITLQNNQCKILTDKVWFKASLKKVMDMRMISWTISINNMNRRRKIKEIVIEEPMLLKLTSRRNRGQSIYRMRILITIRLQIWRTMETMKTKVHTWTLIRWHQRVWRIKITFSRSLIYLMRRSNYNLNITTVDRRLRKK